MVALETGTQWLAGYHNLLARHGLDATTLMDSALTPANREQPALFSLAQLLANPDLLQQQVLKYYQDAAQTGKQWHWYWQEDVRLSPLVASYSFFSVSSVSPCSLWLIPTGPQAG